MNKLSNSIYAYYVKRFAELPLDKQFHFAVRLHAWGNDNESARLLEALRTQLLPDSNPVHTLQAIQGGKLIPLLAGNQNLLELRKEYNQRYPLLRGAARLLYWALMLDYAYDTNSHDAIYSVLPKAELQHMYETLLEDRQAVAILSTHAVNFLYLYDKYCLGKPGPEPEWLFAIGQDDSLYDQANPLHRQLRMYLLTHALIAESMFYTEPLPRERLAVYTDMLKYLESLIEQHMDEVSLDNKLEFLVCCKLTNYVSSLETAILHEAEESVSGEGTFLIDIKNQSGTTYTSFEKSEHRNVLYLMTQLPHKG